MSEIHCFNLGALNTLKNTRVKRIVCRNHTGDFAKSDGVRMAVSDDVWRRIVFQETKWSIETESGDFIV